MLGIFLRIFFFKKKIYLKELQQARVRAREKEKRSFICSSTPQMHATAGAESVRSQELHWVCCVAAGVQRLGPYSAAFLSTLAGSWIRSETARTQTCTHTGFKSAKFICSTPAGPQFKKDLSGCFPVCLNFDLQINKSQKCIYLQVETEKRAKLIKDTGRYEFFYDVLSSLFYV